MHEPDFQMPTKTAPLYKYISIPRDVQFVLRGCLKFTPTAQLNDPNELIPEFVAEDVENSLNELRLAGYSPHQFNWLKRQGLLLHRLGSKYRMGRIPRSIDEANQRIRATFFEDTDQLRQSFVPHIREIKGAVGLFCLSQELDNLPMWTHYADKAKGLVIEFANLEEVFSGDDTCVLYEPLEVNYCRDLPRITFEPSSHVHMFLSKFKDWEYEREFRIILPLAECEVNETNSETLYHFQIPREHIQRIFLGWRLEENVQNQIIEYARSYNPKVEIWTTKLVGGHVKRDKRVLLS